jgi:hypothetical protein
MISYAINPQSNKTRSLYIALLTGLSLFIFLLIATFSGKIQLVFLCKSQLSASGQIILKSNSSSLGDSMTIPFQLKAKTFQTIRIHLPVDIQTVHSVILKPGAIANNSFTLCYILIKKKGYHPIEIENSRLVSLGDLKINTVSNFLVGKSIGKNPEFLIELPVIHFKIDWLLILWYALLSVLVSLALYLLFNYNIRKSFNLTTLISVFCFGIIVVLSFRMALNAHYDASPDEHDHFMASEYFKTHSTTPQKYSNEAVYTYNPLWECTRVNQWGINYWLTGKFSNLFDRWFDSFLSVRFFGILLVFFLFIMVIIFPDQNRLLLPFLITPQVWYVFSYVNDDYFPLCLSFLLLLISEVGKNNLLKGIITKRTLALQLVMGGLLGLLILSKKNYLIFVLLYLFYLFTLPLSFSANIKTDITTLQRIIKRYIRIPAMIVLVALLIVMFRPLTFGEHKGSVSKEVTTFYEQSHAKSLSMKADGVSGKQRFVSYPVMMKQWILETYLSLNGGYGYMRYFGDRGYYIILLTLHLTLILVLLMVLYFWKNRELNFWFLIFSGILLATLFASSYLFSYRNCYQPQGRYLFPVLPFLGLLFYKIDSKHFNRFILPIVLSLYIIGIYSFVFIGYASLCIK